MMKPGVLAFAAVCKADDGTMLSGSEGFELQTYAACEKWADGAIAKVRVVESERIRDLYEKFGEKDQMFLNGTGYTIKDSDQSKGTLSFENNCGYGPEGGLMIKKGDKIVFGVYEKKENKEVGVKLVSDAAEKL